MAEADREREGFPLFFRGEFLGIQGLRGLERKGPFSGVPPKGYRRRDERIREDVCDLLTEADVDVSAIEVRVEDGRVHLSGTVSDEDAREACRDLAHLVTGVRSVHDDLRG